MTKKVPSSELSREKYIIITRPREESRILIEYAEELGLKALLTPSIQITRNILSNTAKKNLSNISSFDWIFFTSRYGVHFFMQALEKLKIDAKILTEKQIGVVGPKTAEEAKKYHLQVHFIPSIFTTADFAREVPNIIGKRILFPSSNIADPHFIEQLETKGATVINIPIYKTNLAKQDKAAIDLLNQNRILCITFTSPSTVEGFVKGLKHQKKADQTKKIFSIPILSIGPVTTQAAKNYGFRSIHTATIHTIEGMLKKLSEIV